MNRKIRVKVAMEVLIIARPRVATSEHNRCVGAMAAGGVASLPTISPLLAPKMALAGVVVDSSAGRTTMKPAEGGGSSGNFWAAPCGARGPGPSRRERAPTIRVAGD